MLSLALLVAAAASSLSEPNTDDGPYAPAAAVDVAAAAQLGWTAIDRRVRRGVRQGVGVFRFGSADREDVISCAMERAWRAYSDSDEPIRNPEAWGRQIARRVSLDELRRQRRDGLSTAVTIEADPTGSADVLEQLSDRSPGALEVTIDAERRTVLRQRIEAWPEPERRVAQLMLDGEAETITAAAHLYRAEQEARYGEGSIYPLKARTLLEARQAELEDLV